MHLALFQPDIPQNTGTILRLCACMSIEAHIIEPAGFPTNDRNFRRAGMDYLPHVTLTRHDSWNTFCAWWKREDRRLVLFTTKARRSYVSFDFAENDILLFGRETAGVPDDVADSANERLLIPVAPGMRSLNVAVSAAMAVGEALRQARPSLAIATRDPIERQS